MNISLKSHKGHWNCIGSIYIGVGDKNLSDIVNPGYQPHLMLAFEEAQKSLRKCLALAWSPAPQSSSSVSFQTPSEISGFCSSSATIRERVLWSNPVFTIYPNQTSLYHPAQIYVTYKSQCPLYKVHHTPHKHRPHGRPDGPG